MAGPVPSSWRNARWRSTGKQPTAAKAWHVARGKGRRGQARCAPGPPSVTGTGSARGPVHRAAKTTAGTGAGHHREAATTGAGAPGSQGKTNAVTTATAGETETAGRARGTGRRAAGWSTPTRWGGPAASPGNGTRVGRAQPSTTIRSGWRGMVKQLPRTRTTRRSWLGCRPRRRRGSVPAPRHPAVLQFAPNRIPASSGQLPPALVSIGVVSIRRRQVLRRKHTRHGHR